MKTNENQEINISTEEKIKEAAKKVFTTKGYAATRTRDIAEESGYNLALINYYFRSKEKLYDIIMHEQLQTFISSVAGLLNDENTSFHEKIKLLVSHYIDMLIANPGLPFFIMTEANSHPEKLLARVHFIAKENKLYILKQWSELAVAGKIPAINPIHILMNLVSMTVFPFIASPLLQANTGLNTEQFNALMEERKTLVPIWIQAILATH
jgi:AcrR family transcriptional regulator